MKMVLTANGAGGVVIPNLPNEPKLSDTFRVTVDAPNIPLTLTAPNDVAFSSKTSVLITAGYVNARSGKALPLTAKWNSLSNLPSVTNRFLLVAISLPTQSRERRAWLCHVQCWHRARRQVDRKRCLPVDWQCRPNRWNC